MNYGWWDYGCTGTEYGIERTDAPADDDEVFERFGDAKAALIRSLTVSKTAYQDAINSARAMRESELPS